MFLLKMEFLAKKGDHDAIFAGILPRFFKFQMPTEDSLGKYD
jgi:hypothetical protein